MFDTDDHLIESLTAHLDNAHKHVEGGGYVAAIVGEYGDDPIWLPASVAYELGESAVNLTDQPETVELMHDGATITVYVYEVV